MPKLVVFTDPVENTTSKELADQILSVATDQTSSASKGWFEAFARVIAAGLSDESDRQRKEIEKIKPELEKMLKSSYGVGMLLGAQVQVVRVPATGIASELAVHGNLDPNRIYAEHPCRKNYYIPIDIYDTYLRGEKRAELLTLLSYLGAKTVTSSSSRSKTSEAGTDASIEAPVTAPVEVGGKAKYTSSELTEGKTHASFAKKPVAGPSLPADGTLHWFDWEPEWKALAQMRLNGSLDRIEIEFVYRRLFGSDLGLVAKAVEIGFVAKGQLDGVWEDREKLAVEFWDCSKELIVPSRAPSSTRKKTKSGELTEAR